MVLKHLLMTSSVIMASGNVNTGWSIPDISACRQTGNGESGSPSQQDSVRDGEHYGYSVSSLSGISSAEFSQLRSDDESRFVFFKLTPFTFIQFIQTTGLKRCCIALLFSPLSVLDFRLGDRYLCDHHDMNGFSEEELLNITFEACDAAGRGRLFFFFFRSLLKLTRRF